MIKTYRGETSIVGQMHEITSDFVALEQALYQYVEENFGVDKETLSDFIDKEIDKGKQVSNLLKTGMTIEEVSEIIEGKESRKRFEESIKSNEDILERTISPKPD